MSMSIDKPEKEKIFIVEEEESPPENLRHGPAAAPGTSAPAKPPRNARPEETEGAELERLTPRAFVEGIRESFNFPYRGSGIFVLIGATAFYFLLYLLGHYVSAILTFGFHLAFDAYVVAYLVKITRETAHGCDELPEWPDVSRLLEEFLYPILLVAAGLFLCFLPAAALRFTDTKPDSPLAIAALILGALCFPMQFLVIAVTESSSSLNPVIVITSIARAPVQYLVLVLSLVTAMVASYFLLSILYIPVPFVGWTIFHFFALYFVFSYARLLGLFYRNNKRRLSWYKK